MQDQPNWKIVRLVWACNPIISPKYTVIYKFNETMSSVRWDTCEQQVKRFFDLNAEVASPGER